MLKAYNLTNSIYLCANSFIIKLMNLGVTFQGVLVFIFNLSLLQCGIKNQWCVFTNCVLVFMFYKFVPILDLGEWVRGWGRAVQAWGLEFRAQHPPDKSDVPQTPVTPVPRDPSCHQACTPASRHTSGKNEMTSLSLNSGLPVKAYHQTQLSMTE